MPSRPVVFAFIGGSLALAAALIATCLATADLERVTRALEAAASVRESGAP